jgi:putative acetyltransferase
VSLETGRGEAFVPALTLYAKHGFVGCDAFGAYVSDEFSQCLTLEI